MLMNTTSFIASQARATISATLHLTASLAVSLKSSLGWAARTKHVQEHEQEHAQGHENVQGQRQEQGRYQMEQQTLQQQQQQQQQQRGDHFPLKESSVVVGQDVDLRQNPMQHQPYPSLQPWKNLDNRIKNFGLMMPASANYAAPRHPIVLCHGLFGFDKMGPETIPPLQIHYWNGIQKALTKLGAKVVVARVPRTGAIQKRAEDLDRMLSRTMEGSPVNFVAHSMGGLDCRYLISHIRDKNYGVQSLTTFSTPHYGSPMMDWFRDNIGVGLLQQSEEEAMRKLGGVAKMARVAAQEASDALNTYLDDAAERANVPNYRIGPNPNLISPLLNRLIPFLDTPAYANLTTTYCREVFNPNTPDDPNVSYYSYGASVPQIPLWAPLGFPWEVIKAKEGDNDGLVSVRSAKWGKYIETVECDHWDLNNRWRLKIGYSQKPFDAVELYMDAATRLFREGH
ncbi:hypothetical protein BG011_004555 [Mortierella polycephala]|uniref:DUF676 domain-containing protein n=1 Tax=Mortierella polycephala TaxID=41804 RepID=A0A9P6QFN5_9FUNG|nr:hypothetical protein BG011_004555 [Mortierella polycephala]